LDIPNLKKIPVTLIVSPGLAASMASWTVRKTVVPSSGVAKQPLLVSASVAGGWLITNPKARVSPRPIETTISKRLILILLSLLSFALKLEYPGLILPQKGLGQNESGEKQQRSCVASCSYDSNETLLFL
jgi:hypothetical protein